MIRIASVSNANKDTLEHVFKQHNMPFRLDQYDNRKGYHVFIERNHDLYFREIIAPEYKAAIALLSSDSFNNIFGGEHATV